MKSTTSLSFLCITLLVQSVSVTSFADSTENSTFPQRKGNWAEIGLEGGGWFDSGEELGAGGIFSLSAEAHFAIPLYVRASSGPAFLGGRRSSRTGDETTFEYFGVSQATVGYENRWLRIGAGPSLAYFRYDPQVNAELPGKKRRMVGIAAELMLGHQDGFHVAVMYAQSFGSNRTTYIEPRLQFPTIPFRNGQRMRISSGAKLYSLETKANGFSRTYELNETIIDIYVQASVDKEDRIRVGARAFFPMVISSEDDNFLGPGLTATVSYRFGY